MSNPPEDPRIPKGKSPINFAILAIAAAALVYLAIRVYLFIQAGE